jgi:hypothetical protein
MKFPVSSVLLLASVVTAQEVRQAYEERDVVDNVASDIGEAFSKGTSAVEGAFQTATSLVEPE